MTSTEAPIVPAEDDSIHIGRRPPAVAGLATIPMPGLTIVTDPAEEAGALPFAIVHDRELARQTVSMVYGDAAADALDTRTPTRVGAVTTEEAEQVHRLGLLRWLDQNRPVPLDPDLLDLEIAVEWGSLPAPMLEGEWNPLDDDLRRTRLAGMAERLRADPSLPMAAELSALFDAALELIPVGDEAIDDVQARLAHERDMAALRAAGFDPRLTQVDLAWMARQMRPTAASQLGSVPDTEGRSSLDWCRVPRHLLPALEGGVRFHIASAGDTAVLDVEVAAASDPPLHPGIPRYAQPLTPVLAALQSRDWPVPIVQLALSYDAQTKAWRGSTILRPAAMNLVREVSELSVGVRSTNLPWSPPTAGSLRRAAARRWAARGLESLRLADPSRAELGATGRAALLHAGRLWAAVGERDAADRCRQLAELVSRSATLCLAERWLLRSGGEM